MELDVLVYNVEYRGGPDTDRVIRELDADVVGVLESYERLPEIAAKTGYDYYNVGLQILSKYPIHEPSGADGLYALIEVEPGNAVAFFNTHLDYVQYGPRLLRRGQPVADVLETEDVVRTSTIDKLAPHLSELLDQDFPVVLTGDFNQPSSLDYTAAAVGTRPGIDEPIAWPVSETLFSIGLRDTYREIHPDPLTTPGLTMAKTDRGGGPRGDRIDYVYAGGPAETLSSELVGEFGGESVDRPFRPWSSDHRAVLSTLAVTPSNLPTTVSLDSRMLDEGQALGLRINAPNDSGLSVAIRASGTETSAVEELSRDVTTGEALSISTAGLAPGGYDVLLVADGDQVAANEFWIRSIESDVRLSSDLDEYAVGEEISLVWDDGPANRWDWLGVYRADAAEPESDDYLLWGYTGGHDSGALPPSVQGTMTFGENSQGRPWPLPKGDYVVHYLLADQYESAGTFSFSVR